MHTQVTAKIVETILQKETKVKKKAMTTKETFDKFMENWKKARVAWDEPYVSVASLLDRRFG
jgi:hypothetical protein